MADFNTLAQAYIAEDERRRRRTADADAHLVETTKIASLREQELINNAIGSLRSGNVNAAAGLVPAIAQQRSIVTGTPFVGPKLNGNSPANQEALLNWLKPTPEKWSLTGEYAVRQNPLGDLETQRAVPEKPVQVVETLQDGSTNVRYIAPPKPGEAVTFGGSPAPMPGNLGDVQGFTTALFGKPVPMTSDFGPRRQPRPGASTNHHGMDLAAAQGAPIRSVINGTVRFSGQMRGYGNTVEIVDAMGGVHRLGHLASINVRNGQTVTVGDNIGLVGSTGVSTGPHLHYEVRVNGKPVRPVDYLRSYQQPRQQRPNVVRASVNGTEVINNTPTLIQGANNYYERNPVTGAMTETQVETPASSKLALQQLQMQTQMQRGNGTLYTKALNDLMDMRNQIAKANGSNDTIVATKLSNNPAFAQEFENKINAQFAPMAENYVQELVRQGALDQASADAVMRSFRLQTNSTPVPNPAPPVIPPTPTQPNPLASPRVVVEDLLGAPRPVLPPQTQVRTQAGPPQRGPVQSQDRPKPPTLQQLRDLGRGSAPALPQRSAPTLRMLQQTGRGRVRED